MRDTKTGKKTLTDLPSGQTGRIVPSSAKFWQSIYS